jgi:hypothetical protein
LCLTKPSTKKKDEDVMDMESLQRIVKKLSNGIVNMKGIMGKVLPTVRN